MATCLVALGSNLGARVAILEQACARLAADPAVRIVARSRWLATRPVGGPVGQGAFINGAIRVETSLTAEAFHALLHTVEAELGRRRQERWAARTIDLDLLLYDTVVCDTPALTLPHPRMACRRFVLEPAAEIAADMLHPAIGWTVRRLLDHLNSAVPYIAVTGPAGAGKTALVRAVAAAAGLRAILAKPAPASLTEAEAQPPADVFADELSLFRQRLRMLDARTWPTPPQAISDFWMGQSLVHARRRIPRPRVAEFERSWDAESTLAMPPKLLAVLASPRSDDAEWNATLREALFEVRPGPVLWLAAGPAPLAFAELLAAIEAMV